MIDPLSNLNLSNPEMGSIGLLTVVALLICHNEFDDEALLQESTIQNFLLYSKFDLDSAGMRLRPHEPSIYKLHSFKAFDLLEAEG